MGPGGKMHHIDPEFEKFCVNHSHPVPQICDQLEDFTQKNVPNSEMLVGKLEASFLGFLIRLARAKRVLEIGTYTGYSALAMASQLPRDGKLITVAISDVTTVIAKKFWDQSPHGKKITSKIGPVLENIQELEGYFDFIFINAAQENVLNYLTISLEKLSNRGVIVVDIDFYGQEIKELNQFVSSHPSLYASLLPLSDGLLLIQKINNGHVWKDSVLSSLDALHPMPSHFE